MIAHKPHTAADAASVVRLSVMCSCVLAVEIAHTISLQASHKVMVRQDAMLKTIVVKKKERLSVGWTRG